jgi:hypothetical protein
LEFVVNNVAANIDEIFWEAAQLPVGEARDA